MTELLRNKLNKSGRNEIGIMFIFYMELPHLHSSCQKIEKNIVIIVINFVTFVKS